MFTCFSVPLATMVQTTRIEIHPPPSNCCCCCYCWEWMRGVRGRGWGLFTISTVTLNVCLQGGSFSVSCCNGTNNKNRNNPPPPKKKKKKNLVVGGGGVSPTRQLLWMFACKEAAKVSLAAMVQTTRIGIPLTPHPRNSWWWWWWGVWRWRWGRFTHSTVTTCINVCLHGGSFSVSLLQWYKLQE